MNCMTETVVQQWYSQWHMPCSICSSYPLYSSARLLDKETSLSPSLLKYKTLHLNNHSFETLLSTLYTIQSIRNKIPESLQVVFCNTLKHSPHITILYMCHVCKYPLLPRNIQMFNLVAGGTIRKICR